MTANEIKNAIAQGATQLVVTPVYAHTPFTTVRPSHVERGVLYTRRRDGSTVAYRRIKDLVTLETARGLQAKLEAQESAQSEDLDW